MYCTWVEHIHFGAVQVGLFLRCREQALPWFALVANLVHVAHQECAVLAGVAPLLQGHGFCHGLHGEGV